MRPLAALAGIRSLDQSLAAVLEARDRRVLKREAIQKETGSTVLTMTVNMPGPVKRTPFSAYFFDREKARLARLVTGLGGRVILEDTRYEETGDEALMALAGLEARAVKALAVEVEEDGPAGRLLDLDVHDPEGRVLSRADAGLSPRSCLLCSRPASICASRRLHPLEDLTEKSGDLLQAYARTGLAEDCAALACEASSFELMVAPKPGLVTPEGPGAHGDMDRFTFVRSQALFSPYYRKCFQIGWEERGGGRGLGSRLRLAGMEAEGAMLEATGGINTHRGWIFTAGILLAALGSCSAGLLFEGGGGSLEETSVRLQAEAARAASALEASLADLPWLALLGGRLSASLTGIREEAVRGFPALFQTGLPVLRASVNEGLNRAGQKTLLALTAVTEDTTLIKRGGRARALAIRALIRDRLAGDPVRGAQALSPDELDRLMEELEKIFLKEGLSAGGAADLLAGCRLLEQFLGRAVIVL